MTQNGKVSVHSPILVSGAHRSGTTWVGKMLAASPNAGYISEPLNVWHRPGVMRAPVEHWYTYICQDNEAQYLPAIRETIAFQYHPWLEVLSLRSLKDALRMGRDGTGFFQGRLYQQRAVLKDPFAVFSAPWFSQRLGCEVVVTVRHPAAFASSLMRLGWTFDFSHLLAQPLLMRDWLGTFRGEMQSMLDRNEDVIAQSCLLWRMVYSVVHQFRTLYPEFRVVRHEDLSVDPIGEFEKLFQSVGVQFTPVVRKAILNSTSSQNPKEVSRRRVYAVRLDSRANLDNWKRRLAPGEIARVRQLTGDVAALYYADREWE
jgi:hypothetical protein